MVINPSLQELLDILSSIPTPSFFLIISCGIFLSEKSIFKLSQNLISQPEIARCVTMTTLRITVLSATEKLNEKMSE